MNGFYNDYDKVIIETPEERRQKVKKQRRLFSRVFLALVVYAIISRFASTGIYMLLKAILSSEKYEAFYFSTIWSLIVGCLAQYVFAFPAFLLMLIGTDKAQNKKREKLTGSEFLLLFFIGQTMMYAGNIIGTFLNNFFGTFMGQTPENEIAAIITETPIWLTFILMVIIAPIVEELIFRKCMIDRLSVYGDRNAIIFSAVTFGLMHGNLYQFFYATLLGALLGYVYTTTRNVKYTVYMHMIINFLGSVVALVVQEYMLDFYEIIEVMEYGLPINLFALIVSATVMLIYSNIQYGMIIGGIITLVHYIRKKKIKINPDKDIFLPDSEVIKVGVVNVGAILFLIITLFSIFINLIPS